MGSFWTLLVNSPEPGTEIEERLLKKLPLVEVVELTINFCFSMGLLDIQEFTCRNGQLTRATPSELSSFHFRMLDLIIDQNSYLSNLLGLSLVGRLGEIIRFFVRFAGRFEGEAR